MAKQVKLDIAPGGRINTTELEVLAYLSTFPGGSVVIARTKLAEVLGKGPATVFRSIASLEEAGLVLTCSRTLRNGARLENEYLITDLGRRVLAAAQGGHGGGGSRVRLGRWCRGGSAVRARA